MAAAHLLPAGFTCSVAVVTSDDTQLVAVTCECFITTAGASEDRRECRKATNKCMLIFYSVLSTYEMVTFLKSRERIHTSVFPSLRIFA